MTYAVIPCPPAGHGRDRRDWDAIGSDWPETGACSGAVLPRSPSRRLGCTGCPRRCCATATPPGAEQELGWATWLLSWLRWCPTSRGKWPPRKSTSQSPFDLERRMIVLCDRGASGVNGRRSAPRSAAL